MKNVNVRIPDELHALIQQAAEHGRRSLNAEILWLIERGLDSGPLKPKATETTKEH